MKSLNIFLLISILINSAFAADGHFPVPSQSMLTGQCAKMDVSCYDLEGMRQIGSYAAQCKSYVQEAKECEKLGSKMASVTPWYTSKWFYLTLGLAVGFGGAAIYNVSK